MKLVAVSVVKNEADIIEAFVRHTHAWVDDHLIFDHDSTDGTRQILQALVEERLPLRLFTGGAVANLQQTRSNYLSRLAFSSYEAEWVLPLDADEFIVCEDRRTLEKELVADNSPQPVSVQLRNYCPTPADDAAELNPVHRIQYRQRGFPSTLKIFVPRVLGLRAEISAGKGSHMLYSASQPIAPRPLTHTSLAHFSLRSPQQQALRVITAELQRLSRGRAHEGLDTHYRLGFQLLSESPDLFFSTVLQPPRQLQRDPVNYLGAPLRHSSNVPALAQFARALLPYLEKLARSHGELLDRGGSSRDHEVENILPLEACPYLSLPLDPKHAFSGFSPVTGWQPKEGPVPEAFLPTFHWATAPQTAVSIHATKDGISQLRAEVLTYAERQVTTVVLNGTELIRHVFTQVNQKETITLLLKLRAGENRLEFRHRSWLNSRSDPRKLAIIFLALQVGEI